ncbi:MAG: UDP-N-acetylmuramate--L-alanine ligase [Candidatus Jacksonbacteria bacterium]|nr:UDP-N-acetylmuramate--L-alanine ligase [Candidatus Jacksonbacteria bacterium]
MTFTNAESVFCIGVGGIGVSAVARLGLWNGKTVAGSDTTESSITQALENEGVAVKIGEQTKAGIPSECDLVVYSSAIPEDNPQRVEAKERGITQLSYPEVLGELSRTRKTYAVAGAHGKSTTTAMLGVIAKNAGKDPLVIVGTLVPEFAIIPSPRGGEGEGGVLNEKENTAPQPPPTLGGGASPRNLWAGESDILIVESCEFSGHFNYLDVDGLIVTNIDADHLDHFGSQDAIDAAFKEFAEKCNGPIIAYGDNQGNRRVLKDIAGVVWYSKDDDPGLELSVPGEYNVLNALAALKMAEEIGVDKEVAVESLRNFKGTWRRFEHVGSYSPRHSDSPLAEKNLGERSFVDTQSPQDDDSIPVISDYAHHPKEIEVTIQAAKEKYPESQILVIFQPHQRHRTKMLLEGFVASLSKADKLIVSEIYDVEGRELGEAVSSKDITSQIEGAVFTKDLEETELKVKELVTDNDVLLFMGAGDIDSVARKLA